MSKITTKAQNDAMNEYLEAILVLSSDFPRGVRAHELSRYLDVKRSSVSHEVTILKEKGLINIEDKFYIKLTEDGHARASETLAKHRFFETKLVQLGVDTEIAHREAGMIGHALSGDSFLKLQEYMK